MTAIPMLSLLFAFSASSCVEGDKLNLHCFESEKTLEVVDGKGKLVYTNLVSGITGSDYHYIIVNDNIEAVPLPKIICNPGDFELPNPTIDSLLISFQGIVQVLPETIDAGSVQI